MLEKLGTMLEKGCFQRGRLQHNVHKHLDKNNIIL